MSTTEERMRKCSHGKVMGACWEAGCENNPGGGAVRHAAGRRSAATPEMFEGRGKGTPPPPAPAVALRAAPKMTLPDHTPTPLDEREKYELEVYGKWWIISRLAPLPDGNVYYRGRAGHWYLDPIIKDPFTNKDTAEKIIAASIAQDDRRDALLEETKVGGKEKKKPAGPIITEADDPRQAQFDLYGENLFGEVVVPKQNPVGKRFVIPPFTVLNTRDGFWRDRSRAWIQFGLKSELGRHEANAVFEGLGDWGRGNLSSTNQAVSIFDPVLCELMYRWFAPPGGQVIDPFAGGSVRGIVAAMCGLQYWGCDLNGQQIAANREQAEELVPHNMPQWVHGDSRVELHAAPRADMVFSCPPYGDLEKYSDDERDLSNMPYEDFMVGMREIITQACNCLRDNRFAVFVVGDFRDKKTGWYHGFTLDTQMAFREAGLGIYNIGVLVNVTGSLPIRITKQFNAGRKLGKTHQDVIVMIKGDWRTATEVCGPVGTGIMKGEVL